MQTADSKYFNPLISKLAIYVGRNLRNDDVVAALTQVCSMHGTLHVGMAENRKKLIFKAL